MPQNTTRTDFKKAFTTRVKEAREAKRFTQTQMAKMLGIPQDHYKQYEGRSYLPHDLIEAFCLACEVDVEFLFTGKKKRSSAASIKGRAA